MSDIDTCPWQIVYEGIKRYRDSYGIEQTMIDPKKDSIVPNDETSLYIDGLVPKTIYSFNISAKYSDGSWGPEYMLKVETSIDGQWRSTSVLLFTSLLI